MAKKTSAIVQAADKAALSLPEKGSHREAIELVDKIVDLLANCDAFQRKRVLDTVQTFYPSHLEGKPSGNGLGYMP